MKSSIHKMKVDSHCVNVEIKNVRNSVSFLFITIFYLLLLLYAVTNKKYMNYVIVLYILLISIIILYIFVGYAYKKVRFGPDKCFTNRNNQDEIYAAVLISDSLSYTMVKNRISRYRKNRVVDMFVAPLYFLEKSFQKRNIYYEFIRGATERDMDELIQDNKCQELYLVGHGFRGGFATSDEKVLYSEYLHISQKKQVVSQLHCNPFMCDDSKNLSLTEIIGIDTKNSFLSKGYCTFVEITYYCIKQWCKSKSSR